MIDEQSIETLCGQASAGVWSDATPAERAAAWAAITKMQGWLEHDARAAGRGD